MYMTCGDISFRWLCTAVTSSPPANRTDITAGTSWSSRTRSPMTMAWVTDLLEGCIGPEGEARLDGHALHGHRQVGAGHPDAEDAAGHYLAGFPERLFDRLPVGVRGASDARGPGQRDAAENDKRGRQDPRSHADFSFLSRVLLVEPRHVVPADVVHERVDI